jgi:hypothetical protein
MSQTRSLILASLLAFMLPETIATADPAAVSPENVTWTVAGDFSFKKKPAKTRESLSGIACPPPSGSPRRCIAAFDEGIEARYVTVDKGTFAPEPDRIVLLAGGKELDAEAAARDGDMVYITGSQSPFRSPCAPRPDSRHVFRFKVDQQTGKAMLAASGKPMDLEDDRENLWKYMNKNAFLINSSATRNAWASRITL